MTTAMHKCFDVVKVIREKDEATLVLGWQGNHRIRRYINLYTIETVIFGACEHPYDSNTGIAKSISEVKKSGVL